MSKIARGLDPRGDRILDIRDRCVLRSALSRAPQDNDAGDRSVADRRTIT